MICFSCLARWRTSASGIGAKPQFSLHAALYTSKNRPTSASKSSIRMPRATTLARCWMRSRVLRCRSDSAVVGLVEMPGPQVHGLLPAVIDPERLVVPRVLRGEQGGGIVEAVDEQPQLVVGGEVGRTDARVGPVIGRPAARRVEQGAGHGRVVERVEEADPPPADLLVLVEERVDAGADPPDRPAAAGRRPTGPPPGGPWPDASGRGGRTRSCAAAGSTPGSPPWIRNGTSTNSRRPRRPCTSRISRSGMPGRYLTRRRRSWACARQAAAGKLWPWPIPTAPSCPCPRRASASRAVEHSGADPQQPAPLRPGLRLRNGPGPLPDRRRLEHRRRLSDAWWPDWTRPASRSATSRACWSPTSTPTTTAWPGGSARRPGPGWRCTRPTPA